MQSLQTGVASGLGTRMLSEIDETSLDQILTSLRTNLTSARNNNRETNRNANYEEDSKENGDRFSGRSSTLLKTFPIAPLDDLVKRHFRATQLAPLSITGRYPELLYVLVATLIAPPHEKAVVIIDIEGRFDALRILATAPYEDKHDTASTEGRESLRTPARPAVRRADLDHVHILRPSRRNPAYIARCIACVEQYMLYAAHQSYSREWWGTVVIGGGTNPAGNPSAAASAQLAVIAGWKGWLRVDRTDTPPFLWGAGVEDALENREQRHNIIENAGWVASCPWGRFTFDNHQSD